MKFKRPCWLVGHNATSDDGGYAVCSCGAHLYYDSNDWKWLGVFGYLKLIPKQGISFFIDNVIRPNFKLCSDCHKPEYIFGKYIGKHYNCIPF